MSVGQDLQPSQRLHVVMHPAPACEGLPLSSLDLPVLPGTRLRLELLCATDLVSLDQLTRVLERDPVAVLRLFALSTPPALGLLEVSSYRLEAWLASMSRQELRANLCHAAHPSRSEQQVLIAHAEAAFGLGSLCREVACTLGLPADLAFLVGLLSEIASLPQRLGRPALSGRTALYELGAYHRLPLPLLEILVGWHTQQTGSVWNVLFQAALEMQAQHAVRRHRSQHQPGQPFGALRADS